MELVYLWVEEYKNIKNQGFNFSTRFECEFDGKTLTINENEDYVSIFPDNINVTAIVGENGSGKSNLLELISDIGYYEDPYRKKDYPVIFSELVQIIVYYNRLINKLYIYKRNLIATVNNKSSVTEKEIPSEFIQKIFIKPTPSHNQQEYLLLLDFLKNNNMDFPFDTPEIISFGIHDDFYDLLNLIENKEFDFWPCYDVYEENKPKKFKIYRILLLLAYLKNYEIDFVLQASENLDITISELENKINIDIKEKIRSFIQTPQEDFSVISSNYVNIKKIPSDFFKIYIEIIKRKNGNEFLDFIGKNVFNFDFYPKISDGQYQLTYIFNSIYSQINQETIFLCIDEGENYLHPNWQKKYINYLYQFLKENFSSKQIHLIISSHSPFLLSDLPKENIVFLIKDDDGNCKNISKDIKLKTFGANIHTLLSNGFFMSDGLMGEFAKNKINEIKKFYDFIQKFKSRINSKEKTIERVANYYLKRRNKFEHIQSIIGEPFLQTIIKNYLDELKEIFDKESYKSNKKQELLKQFSEKELEEYLESLKNDKA
ncbi:ATP-binding protein (AAA domain) [Arcobacter venerupis]|uniref:ATP-binding protein (AAA domain) n=1 Tax=Arcobacter venerupis TaxID=1054033 RepID=A0AAE7E3D8_9BACT|nr:AAA family ATPase [Arcobacter venerupis]QKF66730.1 ATP-binding protein (AAA domain) [Arcobacter venerupis]RWS48164.1 hypothetical protein CKA56_15495 [Arcobacter venerupis]